MAVPTPKELEDTPTWGRGGGCCFRAGLGLRPVSPAGPSPKAFLSGTASASSQFCKKTKEHGVLQWVDPEFKHR